MTYEDLKIDRKLSEWNFYQMSAMKNIYDWKDGESHYRITEHANCMYTVYKNGGILGWFETVRDAVTFLDSIHVTVFYQSPGKQKPVGVRTDIRILEVTDTNHEIFLCNPFDLALYDLTNIASIRHYWNNELSDISKADVKAMILDRYKGIMSGI